MSYVNAIPSLLSTTQSRKSSSLSAVPCPSVFIYDTLPHWSGDVSPQSITVKSAYGDETAQKGVYNTAQYSLSEIIINRLYRSEHCKVTKNASAADLFLIPALSGIYRKRTLSRVQVWKAACEETGMTAAALAPLLPHLSIETAARHLFIMGKSHSAVFLGPSSGSACDWARGDVEPFKHVQRLAYSHSLVGMHRDQRRWFYSRGPLPRLDGRFMSVPYPSAVHWSPSLGERPPWTRFDDRPHRINYVGRPIGEQDYLRRLIVSECNRIGRPTCVSSEHFNDEALMLKQKSVFCLEPEGGEPFRKSIYDSITSGCIPVFFSHDTDAVAPWHWGCNRQSMRVLLPAPSSKSRKVDLSVLLSMPAAEVTAIQTAVGAHAQRLHYALDDMPGGDDAFEVLLKKAHLRAQGVSLDELAGCGL
jgi:hypothetical protein